MVLVRLTPLKAMRVIKRSVFMLGIILPGPNSSARDYLVNEILVLIAIVNSGFILTAMIGTIIGRTGNLLGIVELIPEITILGAIYIRLFIWRLQRRNLQKVLDDWQNFVTNATPEEEVILQQYCDRVGPLHLLIFVLSPMAVLTYLSLPAFTSKNLPIDLGVFFETKSSSFLWFLMYFFEIHAACIAGSAAIMDLILLELLWSTSARFEMLHADFRKIKCVDDVRRCVQQQIHIEQLLTEQKYILNWMGFTITLVVLIGVSTGGFVIINGANLQIILFFALCMTINIIQLFMYCWAGDSLMVTSQGLVNACFGSDWINASREMEQCLMIMSEGSRRPMVICVDGLLPIMSLEYFASSMSAVVSYITTLRAFAK